MSDAVIVADGLDFPTSIAFDDRGRVYVAESGLPFGGAAPGGRIRRIDPYADPSSTSVVANGLAAPVTGLSWHDDILYVSEGGAGRISRIDTDAAGVDPSRAAHPLIEGMPGPGNYHTNMAVVGPDRKLYFSQGAMTNLGVIGLDAYELGWLRRLPHAHDVPGIDIALTGLNVTTPDPFSNTPGATRVTGSFVPFGTSTEERQRIPAGLPCTAAVMRCDLDGSNLELVAWGLRNAFGLGFLPDGRLLAVDQGPDDRGSRPIGDAPDLLFEVRPGRWYGWPDYVGGVPVTDPRFEPVRGPQPTFLLTSHETLPDPEQPLFAFTPHAAATKFAAVPAACGQSNVFAGRLVVTLFGDETPMTAPHGHPQVGRGLQLIDPADWSAAGFKGGPDLARPIDVKFAPDTGDMFLLDFGRFEMSDEGVQAQTGTGRLWRWGDWQDAVTAF
ncbi:PQQ-dependent sugar dehydrogenase [Micromonospora sp. WMMA1363]|uniref:PQQ-dependent sugar dehydrogenase n=1 Tax=Micromonospora sp. WMMA1363 TaxID=3053985 RepID=UPI00259C6FB5|nr:PQQ-dependent sugar dehydrogenase [Micromonospora sp. WMMA1363]MDM4719659.1 PQQ-dependent sugar dehydrogenase [Micromonospora sp. WMMA1363]